MDSKQVSTKPKSSLKAKVQRFGTALSGMIMPNIAAIIAWGLVTALFMVPGGWMPNKHIAQLINPMLHYLLPLLIGYVGGRMVYEERGAVVGAIATTGVIVGAKVPMFLGAMIMGPLGGWCIKKFDQLFLDKIKTGFEMIYNNFSAGILGMILAIIGQFIVNPLVVSGSNLAAKGVAWIISVHLLPLANVFIEPAKVLFLNNAVGNGILVPLGIQQASQAGKSILFLLESNPGPGLGILLAFCMFGKGNAKASAPGAVLIHFFGGVHEIYFPYILMKPMLIISAILGGVAGTFTFQIMGAGLKAAASPGSIIAVLLMTPKGSYLANLAGVLVAAVVSFVVSVPILKNNKSTDEDLDAKKEQMEQMKSDSKATDPKLDTTNVKVSIQKIIFACDAGMGSSAMGASLLRDKLKKEGVTDVPVTNLAVRNLKPEPNLLVVTQNELAERALEKTPDAMHVSVDNFMNSPRYDEIAQMLKQDNSSVSEVETKQPGHSIFSDIDFAQIKQIRFVTDSHHVGSTTMAVSEFNQELQTADKALRADRVILSDVKDQADQLLVTTTALQADLRAKVSQAQVVVVSNMLENDDLKELVLHLN
ncbi:PTS mannitol transporter subunit IICB [Bombilactobacillus folatiphilus]|uniref:PTS system mannitol-specific EIICB component n=1 Tax=Bombilactobacillus folatiphilus TaxID=2923362 RepID=A0ABY4PB01_9LACO|nr:PTS mannitol transporter subunit IICB [Bombilactobacillus folatiphilus]UQS82894.1 PTS mannitol transporter subunit IICB [Bombilactobacillus folatiphilus]